MSFGFTIDPLSGIASVVNGFVGVNAQKKSEQRQFEYNKQLQQQQHDFAMQQMRQQFDYNQQAYMQQRDDERSYNDPSSVRSRLSGAGLNPYITGSDGSSAGGSVDASFSGSTGSSGPSSSAVSTSPINPIQSFIDSYNSLRMADAEIKLKDKQADNIEEDTISKSNLNSIFDTIKRLKNAESSSAESKSVIDRIDALFAPLRKSKELANMDADWFDKVNSALKSAADVELSKSQRAELDSLTNYYNQLTSTEVENTRKTAAEAASAQAFAKYSARRYAAEANDIIQHSHLNHRQSEYLKGLLDKVENGSITDWAGIDAQIRSQNLNIVESVIADFIHAVQLIILTKSFTKGRSVGPLPIGF